MYRLREERDIEPQTMANLVSSTLYERRFGPYFVSPVIAGINQRTGEPFICGFDSIGCIDFAKDFIVSGTASDQLFGTCEALWEPDLEPEDLFETCSQALLNAVDRDALSGKLCWERWMLDWIKQRFRLGLTIHRLGRPCLCYHEGQDNQEVTQGYVCKYPKFENMTNTIPRLQVGRIKPGLV